MEIYFENKEGIASGTGRSSIFDSGYPLRKSSWMQVFSASLGQMAAVQEAFYEKIAGRGSCAVDLNEGWIKFGDDSFKVQFIGGESDEYNSWQWGFNEANGLSRDVCSLAEEASSLGDAWHLQPLTVSDFVMNSYFNGDNLAITACAISHKNYCYIAVPGNKGKIYLGVEGVPSEIFSPVSKDDFVRLTGACIHTFAMDQKIFIESFLMWNGTPYDRNGDDMIARFGDDHLCISFEKVDDMWTVSGLSDL